MNKGSLYFFMNLLHVLQCITMILKQYIFTFQRKFSIDFA